ncbi:fasciclin-1 [Caerostris extrusa]|uniref:Fasciclin-1 n=1 Tax=Caerostris extrusa TaxID=172846 RepID=A0AAV4VQZ0_CAEEX|nr:fasciclin-1 [Caerostris extrusa]
MRIIRITYELGEQDKWGSTLNSSQKRFTFFVPGNDAWAQMRIEMPTEFKQLTMGMFPYHVHKILFRHLVVNRELRSTDLERLKGNSNGPWNFQGELLLEWEGIQARIIRPDVQAVNGVIHVIDRVMMKRRDLTKSGSPIGPYCSSFLLVILTFVQVAILF